MFKMMTDLGVEGCMVSPGYQYDSVPNQELFLSRKRARQIFKNILDPKRHIRFYNNPLYLDFLRGDREYDCTAWANPTYTTLGWREPCYLLGDRHTQNLDDLMDEKLWERFGPGRDPRCASCLMHCGFESASIFGAISSPRDVIKLVKEGALQNSGVGAS
jgi:hopanoid biosynthesis associated radical SAM protein HpnH